MIKDVCERRLSGKESGGEKARMQEENQKHVVYKGQKVIVNLTSRLQTG